jgi:antitoxin component YwqK of YwqJK toxin-antitoxin module
MHFRNFNQWALFLMILLFSCQNKHLSKIEYLPNGNIKKIISFTNDSERSELNFYENGNLKDISHFASDTLVGEQLNFYESGPLASKFLLKDSLPNGTAYWFYKSGSLKSSRFYLNGNESDLGFDYWDNKFVINKALLRFNGGRLYYKLNFDSGGRPTTQEGDSLHSDVFSPDSVNGK